jgi:hypothetical protein
MARAFSVRVLDAADAMPLRAMLSMFGAAFDDVATYTARQPNGAPVLGEPMARLLGALGELALPNSGIVVRIPVEKIFHVDGRPRESFIPCAIEASRSGSPGQDPELQAAVNLATKLVRRNANLSSQSKDKGCG